MLNCLGAKVNKTNYKIAKAHVIGSKRDLGNEPLAILDAADQEDSIKESKEHGGEV